MSDRSAQRTLNLDTCEALQAVGLTEPQARALAAAVPDLEPLRVEMNHLRMELRSEMDRHFAGLERRLNAQTWAIMGTLVVIGGILVATNLPA